jgi:hypothetical protein
MFRALASLFLLASCAAAAAARIEVDVPQKSGGIVSPKVAVFDLWPESCSSQVESVVVEDRDIVLRAALSAAGCNDRALSGNEAESRLDFSLPLLWAGTYRVRYEVRPRPGADPELHGFRLVDFDADSGAALRPETGLWWPEQGGEFDRGGPGLGLLMEAQADTLSLTMLGYGAGGDGQWSYGASRIEGRVVDIALAHLADGAGPFAPYRAPKALSQVGTVQVELLSAARANLWFLRPAANGREISIEPLSMVRFSFAQTTPDAWLGRWVIAAESGDTPASRHVDFSAIVRDAAGFTLLDARGEYRLDCSTSPQRPNSPPTGCDLLAADGSREIHFDRAALAELRGYTLTGEPVAALKLGR